MKDFKVTPKFFVTVYVDSLSMDKFSLEKFKPLNPTRFFLELPEVLPSKKEKTILRLRDNLRKRGFKPGAGIRPIPMVQGGDNPSLIGDYADATASPCYQSQAELERFKQLCEWAAKEFDEVVFDDGIMTTCTCGKCIEEKGTRTWAKYRMEKMVWITREYIIKPIKKINPDCQTLVKFPQWLESLHHCGYDAENHIRNFDKVVVWIEANSQTEQHQHIPAYGSFLLYRWFSEMAKDKIYPYTWLDNYRQDVREYIQQIYQAVLAGAEGLILWCNSTHSTKEGGKYVKALAKELNNLIEFRQFLGQPKGISIYMPVNSDGEYFIHAYFGMLGIPLSPCSEFPEDEPMVILTEHAIVDKDIVHKILNHLKNGGDIMATSGLIKSLEKTEIGEIVSDKILEGQVTSNRYRLYHWNKSFRGQKITIPFVYRYTWPSAVIGTLVTDSMDHPLIARYPYFNGNLYMLTVPFVQSDLYKYPPVILEGLRKIFAPYMGLWLKGPSRIGLYPYSNCVVLVNFSKMSQKVSISADKSIYRQVLLKPFAVKVIERT